MQEKYDDNFKVAVLLRTFRGLVGMSQKEFAEWLGLPVSTITRTESMESQIKLSDYHKVLEKMNGIGVIGNFHTPSPVIELEDSFFEFANDLMVQAINARKDKQAEKKGQESVRYTKTETVFLENQK